MGSVFLATKYFLELLIFASVLWMVYVRREMNWWRCSGIWLGIQICQIGATVVLMVLAECLVHGVPSELMIVLYGLLAIINWGLIPVWCLSRWIPSCRPWSYRLVARVLVIGKPIEFLVLALIFWQGLRSSEAYTLALIVLCW